MAGNEGLGRMDVLLVEDEPLVREMLHDDLVDAGLHVFSVGSAEDGLDAFKLQAPPAPAVVVTDVNLGPGMDGVAFAEVVRREWPNVAVVVMTGDERNVGRLPDELRGSCLAKPFEPRRLVAAVNQRMGR